MNAIARVLPQPVEDIRNELVPFEPEIAEALPPGITVDRFKQVVLAAVTNSMGSRNDLTALPLRRSLLGACVKAAGSGLLPDGKEGALVIMKNQVAWMPMVQGIVKLARNSGLVSSLVSAVVYEGEEFEIHLGDRQEVVHKWDPEAVTRGRVFAAYAIAKLRNPDGSVGDRVVEPMTRSQIEDVKKVSSSGDRGPWGSWYGEMARKTAIRRLFKALPYSPDDKLLQAIYAVDEDYEFDRKATMPPAKGPTIDAEAHGGAQPKDAVAFEYIKTDGEIFAARDSIHWRECWEDLVASHWKDNSLAQLREDWERNRDLMNGLKRAGFKELVVHVEDKIRVALGLEAPESVAQDLDAAAERERKAATVRENNRSVLDSIRTGQPIDRPLEDSMPGGGGPAAPKPGEPSAAKGLPYLDAGGNLQTAASPKQFSDGLWSALSAMAADPDGLREYGRSMGDILESMGKSKDERTRKLSRIAFTMIDDAKERARAMSRANTGRDDRDG